MSTDNQNNFKFRVLDKHTNKLYYGSFRLAAQAHNRHRYSKVMQFSGIKDHTKREIYQGDIVKAIYIIGCSWMLEDAMKKGDYYTGEVIFHAGAFHLKINKAPDHESIVNEYDIGSIPELCNFSWVEVIDNINHAEDA